MSKMVRLACTKTIYLKTEAFSEMKTIMQEKLQYQLFYKP